MLAEELGHLPKRNEVPLLMNRKDAGPWPRVPEAGSKEIGPGIRKQQKKKERKRQQAQECVSVERYETSCAAGKSLAEREEYKEEIKIARCRQRTMHSRKLRAEWHCPDSILLRKMAAGCL